MNRQAEPLRIVLMGVATLAALALLALFLRGHGASGTSTGPATERGGAQHEVPDAGAHASVANPPEAASRERVPELTAAPPAPRPEREVGVDVVRAETGEPVPEAQVWCWPRSPALASDGDFEEWLRNGRVEEQLASARALRADRQGHANVPEHEQGFVIVATAGELWGWASFGSLREGSAQVALARDVDLRVQVVDSEGVGVAGLPVALRERRGSASFERLHSRSAGADGLAVLRHAGHFLRALRSQGGELVVGLQELFDPPLELRLRADALPEEPIRFVLRPSGSCSVALVDGSGEIVGGALEARLHFADAPRSGAEARPAQPSETRSSRSGGRLIFEHVELGRAVAVEVRREGSEVLLEARGPGPQKPGERVELRLLLEPGVAVLRGRVLDGSGAPLCERELRARLEAGEERQIAGGERRLWTSADGRFALPTELGTELPAAQLALCALAGDGSELAIGRLPLPAELGPGSTELGDCVLGVLPLLASGRVVGEDGQGLAGALVRALGERDGLASVRTDAAGGFELRAEAAGGELALGAELASLVGDPLSVRVPARDLRLVLHPGGALAGRVLLDPSLQRSLVLVQAAPGAPASRIESTVLGQDGRFALGGLAPGTYSLRVVYAPNASELATLGGLEVRAGPPTRDPRLDPLDLCTRQRLLELELVDGQGLPVAEGRAYSRPSGETDARWSFAEASGSRLQILCDGRPLDVTIAAEGFLCSELEHLAESRRVVLQRAAQLRLELAGGLALPEPPLYLGLELKPPAGGGSCGFVESRLAFFGPDGVLSCSSARAGALRAEVVVQRRAPGALQLVHAVEPQPRVLQIAPDPSLQVFSIRIDPAALAAAVAAARSGD